MGNGHYTCVRSAHKNIHSVSAVCVCVYCVCCVFVACVSVSVRRWSPDAVCFHSPGGHREHSGKPTRYLIEVSFVCVRLCVCACMSVCVCVCGGGGIFFADNMWGRPFKKIILFM